MLFFLIVALLFVSANEAALSQDDDKEDISPVPIEESPVPGILNTFDTLSVPIMPAHVFALAVESEYGYTVNVPDDPETYEGYPFWYDSLIYLSPLLYRDENEGLKIYMQDKPIASKIFQDAEEQFHKGEMLKAREKYMKVLELDPDAALCSLYIAQTYNHTGHPVKYKEKLEAFLEKYPNNGLALRFKGLDLYSEEEYEESLDYMIKSTILNRNNPMNTLSLNKALSGMDMQYAEWEFIPRYNIDSLKPGNVSFTAHPEWVLAASVDMVYEFDPAVKRRSHYKGDLGKERQLALMMALVSKEGEDAFEDHKDPALATLYEALEEDNLFGYFLYEVLLPRYPYYAFFLSEEEVSQIYNYLEEHRFIEIEEEDE